MLEVSALGWTLTIAVIVALLALDLTLGVFRPHTVGFREAAAWSIFYIAVAVAFGFVFASVAGWDYGTQYFAGYIVEKSLSVDNLFVFVIIMGTFAVPDKYQQEVLTFGIIIALALRVVFILLGATLLPLFSFMFLIFGLNLIYTAVQLFRHRDEDPDPDNAVVRAAKRLFPSPTSSPAATCSPGSTAGGPPRRCSSHSSPSAAPTCCSRSTRSRRCSA